MKVLFIKLGAFGDVINTLPLAVFLKKALNAEIHWLVAPLSYDLVKNHSAVDSVILFDKKTLRPSLQKVRKELKPIRYDLVLDLQRTLKSGFFTLLAHAERKIGFDRDRCKEMTWLFPFERIAKRQGTAHMLEQYMDFARYLGYEPKAPRWDIPVFGRQPEGLPDQYVVLNTGATKAANKWRIDYFALLADKIETRFGTRSILTGGPEDSDFAEAILQTAKSRPVNLVGKTSLGDLTEVVRNAQTIVSCDTGPMHLGVALGKKVIALFGPSDPVRTGPYKGLVIRKNAACAPCNKKICNDPVCMSLITPEDVLKEMADL